MANGEFVVDDINNKKQKLILSKVERQIQEIDDKSKGIGDQLLKIKDPALHEDKVTHKSYSQLQKELEFLTWQSEMLNKVKQYRRQ